MTSVLRRSLIFQRLEDLVHQVASQRRNDVRGIPERDDPRRNISGLQFVKQLERLDLRAVRPRERRKTIAVGAPRLIGGHRVPVYVDVELLARRECVPELGVRRAQAVVLGVRAPIVEPAAVLVFQHADHERAVGDARDARDVRFDPGLMCEPRILAHDRHDAVLVQQIADGEPQVPQFVAGRRDEYRQSDANRITVSGQRARAGRIVFSFSIINRGC